MKLGRKLAVLMLAIISVVCFIFAVGCTSTGELGETYEYMQDVVVPQAPFGDISENELISGKVTYIFQSPKYKSGDKEVQDVYESVFPNVYCNVVGTWTVTYVYGNQKAIRTFEVRDTIAPKLEIPELASDVSVDPDTRYALPRIEVEDLSPIDQNSIKYTMTLNGSPIEIKNKRYQVPEAGEIVFTVEAADIYGNKASKTVSWKKLWWKPSVVPA